FNRVHFEWKPREDTFDITMQARGLRFQPTTNVARMAIVDRRSPVFDYSSGKGMDRWTVAKWALGKKDGARWLPVRFPALYAGDVFRTLARSNGIILPPAGVMTRLPEARVVASVESAPLNDMLKGMMRYSTNLTAEAAGMAASLSNGVPVADLLASGSRMAGWVETALGARGATLRDHSGLGYGSAIGARAMAEIVRKRPSVKGLMRPVNVANADVQVVAKTGTLNFVSTLAGFMTMKNGRQATFAIFTADTMRRDAIPPEQRERPRGSRSWARRSRNLQKSLLAAWAGRLNSA
ncbi:MAG: D-alanyl-D-alanine carboxypeptidase, partial [Pseudomonadota bacterium]